VQTCALPILDVYYTYRLKNYLLKRLKADDDQALYKLFRHLMMPASQMYTDVEYNGVYLDKKALEEANEYLEKEMAAVKKELDKFKKGLNCNSPQQIAAYLFGDLGLDPQIGRASCRERVWHLRGAVSST